MNIFYLDRDLNKCVEYMVDKHVVKMPLEYAQMLCTAINISNPEQYKSWMYKPTHRNHPCSIWARQSIRHWKWLRDLSLALNNEWVYRYNHKDTDIHKSVEVIMNLPEPDIKDNGWIEPPQAMPEYCKATDVIEAYRNYYKMEKKHLFNWTKRNVPYFLKMGV